MPSVSSVSNSAAAAYAASQAAAVAKQQPIKSTAASSPAVSGAGRNDGDSDDAGGFNQLA